MPGYRKEHDWFAENLANPSFSNTDFKSVGINASNTSLGPIDVYLNSPEVQSQEVFQTNGQFDQQKVRAYYMSIAKSYNKLATDTFEQDLMADKNMVFSQYNIFVPVEQRRTTIPTTIEFSPNPDHITIGLVDFNTPSRPTKTPEELSESQPIWDPDTKTWTEDTPEDSFFKYFFRPTVLATWDYDADINGNPTSDPSKIVYQKGQPKVNEFGEYYQEFLNGRSSDGKKLLHKTNILTREDSWLNEYDPFDNDGFDKSVWGSIALNAIKIVPLFIPYVGEAYLYTSLGLGAAEALTTLGRMFKGSDNAFLNTATSVMESFHTTSSEHASQSAFSIENVLNMVGSTFEFIKGQRLLATKAPEWFGQKIPKNQFEFNTKVTEMVESKMRTMGTITGDIKELNQALRFEATAQLQQQIQNFQKLGQTISRNYMAISFGTHTYSTAKAQGVSDEAATILTLGAIGGQYALLNSHIGNWIFPEAKLESQELRMIAKKLPEVIETDSYKVAQDALNKATTTGEKLNAFKGMFKLGKSLASKVYSSPMQSTASAVGAGAIASGVEMVSFSVLDDIIAQVYNTAQWLSGSDHRMSAWEDIGSRYLSSFLGGAFAGVLSAKDMYKASKAMYELNPKQAFEKLVSIVADGKTKKFLKELDETSWGNKYLSAETYGTSTDGAEIYKMGLDINNQDQLIKDAIRQQVKIIENVLKSNDVNIRVSSLLKDDKTIGLVKTSLLQGSVVVKDYIGNLNKKLARLVEVHQEIAGISDPETRKQEKEIKDANKNEEKSESKKNDIPVNNLEALREERRQLIQEIHKYKTGEIMSEYMPKAIFDMSPGINSAFINANFASYTERTYNKSVQQLTNVEKQKAEKDYKEWVEKNKLYAVNEAYDLFQRTNAKVSEYLGKLKQQNVFKDLNLYNTKALKHLLVESLRMQDLINGGNTGLMDSTTELALGSVDFKANTRFGIIQSIITDINLKGAREQDRLFIQSLRNTIESDEFKDNREQLNEFINLVETALYKDEILDMLESDLKGRKFIESNLKQTLDDILVTNLSADAISQQLFGSTDFLVEGVEKLFENPEVSSILNFEQFKERLGTLDIFMDSQHRELDVKSTLSKITDFDLLNTISQFGKDITNGEFDLRVLFRELDQIFNKNQETIDKFFLGQDKLNMIDLGLLVIDMFGSGTIAANNVVDSVKNIFAYNITVNSINKNNDLTVLDSNYVASQLNTLNILSTKLNYYKKLALYARANKFNQISNVENSFRVTLYKQINDKISKIPTGWNGVDELKTAIGGLADLQRLSSVKFSSLNQESQNKLIKEYVQFEEAIHDFFSKNEANIKNKEELVKFLNNFDLINLTPTSIEAENFKDDQSLVWYLATLAALDPRQFYSNFVKSDITGIAPTFSRMTQVNLIGAKVFNKEIYDNFTEAYNEVVDKALMTRDPEKYKFDGRRVKYGNIILLQSGAGAGKSFAILPLAINFIKQINPKLLNNIWVASTCPVSKTKEGMEAANKDNTAAKKLISQWKLNSNNAFTRHQLMNMISSEWHETLNDELELEISEADAETDYDAGLQKYNFKLRQYNKSDLPDIIIIDEIADYSELDMELIDRFAKRNEIQVIAAGDLSQIGLIGKCDIEINGSKDKNILYLSTDQFQHTFYNTANYRTENSLQDKNIVFDRVLMSQKNEDVLDIPAYQYYVNEDKGLFGRQVIYRKNLDAQKEAINLLLKTANKDKRIGYVYDDENSEIYRYVKDNFEDEFDFFYKYPVKGEEAQYYVYDLSSEPRDENGNINKDVLSKVLYTVFTRSKQGSLFIKPASTQFTNKIRSVKVDYVTVAGLDFVQLQKYSDTIVKVLQDIYPNPIKLDTTKKAKNNTNTTTNTTTSTTTNNDSEGITVPEDQKDLKYDNEEGTEEEVPEDQVPKGSIAFTLDNYDSEITIVDVVDEEVDKQIIRLNKAEDKIVPKEFEYSENKTRILLSRDDDGKRQYVDSNITEVFNLGLYTRFNNYTGLIQDPALGFKLSDGVGYRKDNYYGLQNLFKLLNVDEASRQDYTLRLGSNSREHNIEVKRKVQKFLQDIRNLNYSIAKRKELEKEIFNLINRTFGIELQDPYIRFIWESTRHDQKKDSIFYRSRRETPDDPYLKENSAKGISIIIGSNVDGKDQTLMTVPLAKLPYWRTVVEHSEGRTSKFFRDLLRQTEQEVQNEPSDIRDYMLRKKYLQKLEDILKEGGDKYQLGTASLYHLLKIYQFNYPGAVFLDQGTTSQDPAALLNYPLFTLARYFKNTGPFIFANERKGYIVEEFTANDRTISDTAQYNDIRELVAAGQFTISKIMVTKNDVKNDNGVTLIQAGRPYVLIGDSSLKQSELSEVWKAQAHDPSLPIRVKKGYLRNPESNLKEFIEQLESWGKRNSIVDGSKEKPLVGNDLTSFRIIDYLRNNYSAAFDTFISDQQVQTIFDAAFEGTFDARLTKIQPALVELFNKVNGLSDSAEILSHLKEQSGYRNLSYGRLLNLALRIILDPKWYEYRQDGETLHEAIKSFIESEQSQGKMQKIFYNIRFGEAVDQLNGVDIFEVKVDELDNDNQTSYTLNNKPFTINFVMTPILAGDIYPLLQRISTNIRPVLVNGKWTDSMTATGPYANNDTRQRIIVNEVKPKSKVSVKVENEDMAERLGLDKSNWLSKSNINSTIETFQKNGYPAFKLNDTTYLLSQKPAEVGNNGIRNISIPSSNEIVVDYEGDKNVRLVLQPKEYDENGKVKTFSVVSSQKKVTRQITETTDYFNDLYDYVTNNRITEDELDKAGVVALRYFRDYISEELDASIIPSLERIGYTISNNRIEFTKENFKTYVENVDIEGLDEFVDDLLVRLEEDGIERTRQTNEFEDFMCNIIFKL